MERLKEIVHLQYDDQKVDLQNAKPIICKSQKMPKQKEEEEGCLFRRRIHWYERVDSIRKKLKQLVWIKQLIDMDEALQDILASR